MKIRTGYISNSSTSCFICGLWGSCDYSVEETVEILQKMLTFYNDMEDENLDFENVFEHPQISNDKDIDLLDGWDVRKSDVENNMLIYGKGDNSIPYLLFGFIEQKFDAKRIHLG